MNIRVVIFDVYKTLLEVGPPPVDADAGWTRLWREQFGEPARLSLPEFGDACAQIIVREHAIARRAGISFPEIFWPMVAIEALPELAPLSAPRRDYFLFRHAQLVRTLRLIPGAAATLRFLVDAGVPLGIASNAQPYTLRELDAALAETGLGRAVFDPALCFWSFDHGFSKPDPHVFRLLTARLCAAGIANTEALMVGDRLDNDIAPARVQGWQTWHLAPDSINATSGDWSRLQHWLTASGTLREPEP